MRNTLNTILIILFYIIVSFNASLSGQIPKSISGTIIDAGSYEPIPSATVVLLNNPDSVFISGTTSQINGDFMFGHQLLDEKYILRISYVGYNTFYKNLASDTLNDAHSIGKVLLNPDVSEMNEFVVTGERIQAATGNNKSIFYINKRIQEASNTGLDVIKYIPGVFVDFMQNITLEGNRNVLIMVDGRERDMEFLRQLNAKNIDRIEISRMPDSSQQAGVSGIIHIIMRERQTGFGGFVHAEIPTSLTEVYIFPAYSFSYGWHNLNLITSYSGSIANMDITESTSRHSSTQSQTSFVDYMQHVRQKNWSHRFNYGLDWYIGKKNQLNYYGFINPYSREHDGHVLLKAEGGNGMDGLWSATKEDTDENRIFYNSLYFKHTLSPGREIILDLSHYSLSTGNTTTYTADSLTGYFLDEPNAGLMVSSQMPHQHTAMLKLDYSHTFSGKWKAESGVRGSIRNINEGMDSDFTYQEQLLAGHASMVFTGTELSLTGGLRFEQAESGLTGGFKNNSLNWLPFFNANYQLTPAQNIQLSCRQMVNRPNLYQLNPVRTTGDPLTAHFGNPGLRHSLSSLISLEYSLRTGNNFITARVFRSDVSGAISQLTGIGATGLFETHFHNLGDMTQYGMQFSGALRPGKFFAINPFVRFYKIRTIPGELAGLHDILPKNERGYEAGISAIFNLPYGVALSMQGQYSSPLASIQGRTFSDALYFCAINKSFSQQFRLGLSAALPFSRSFIYQGLEIKGQNFYTHSKGNVMMSHIPVWFTLRYQFSSGKAIERINHVREDVERLPGKGF